MFGKKAGPCCHKCGAAPNTDKPAASLSVCKKCGKYTCNNHLVGWTASTCPACDGDTQVVARQSNSFQGNKSSGGGFGFAKSGAKANTQSSSASGFGGSGNTSGGAVGGVSAGAGSSASGGAGGGAASGSFNLGGGGSSSVQEAEAPEKKEPEKATEQELYGTAAVSDELNKELDTKAEAGKVAGLETEYMAVSEGALVAGGTQGNEMGQGGTEAKSTNSENSNDDLTAGFESGQAAIEEVGINLDFSADGTDVPLEHAMPDMEHAGNTTNNTAMSDDQVLGSVDVNMGQNKATETESAEAIDGEIALESITQEVVLEDVDVNITETGIETAVNATYEQNDEIATLGETADMNIELAESETIDMGEQVSSTADAASAHKESEQMQMTNAAGSKEVSDDSKVDLNSRQWYLEQIKEKVHKIEQDETNNKANEFYLTDGLMVPAQLSNFTKHLQDFEQKDFDFTQTFAPQEAWVSPIQLMKKLGVDQVTHFASVGLGPKLVNHLSDDFVFEINSLETMLNKCPKVISIGPIGLDMKFAAYTKDKQIELFKRQLALAESFHLPVIIRHVNADLEIIEALNNYQGKLLFCDVIYTDELTDFIKQSKNRYALMRSEYTHKSYHEQLEKLGTIPLEQIIIGAGESFIAPASRAGVMNSSLFIEEIYQFASVYFRKEKQFISLTNVLNIGEFYSQYQRPVPVDPYAW